MRVSLPLDSLLGKPIDAATGKHTGVAKGAEHLLMSYLLTLLPNCLLRGCSLVNILLQTCTVSACAFCIGGTLSPFGSEELQIKLASDPLLPDSKSSMVLLVRQLTDLLEHLHLLSGYVFVLCSQCASIVLILIEESIIHFCLISLLFLRRKLNRKRA